MVRPFGAACTRGGINAASRAASDGPRGGGGGVYLCFYSSQTTSIRPPKREL
jgi:hypothetical protein